MSSFRYQIIYILELDFINPAEFPKTRLPGSCCSVSRFMNSLHVVNRTKLEPNHEQYCVGWSWNVASWIFGSLGPLPETCKSVRARSLHAQ